ncbi:MAG TPA: HAMP domain-containing sensor histidine kinase [Gemmatimonadales bacterium]|nr:HAMP domain-containing sensor histidine kinase [Gemmatimonadales bacterium]
MSFRARLFIAILVAVLVPLSALALGVRREMQRRLTGEYQERVAALATVMETDLQQVSATLDSRLAALAADLVDDNRFRLGLRGEPGSRKYLLDYAGQAMRLSGLSHLQLQDSSGKILSSGHFRNEFDQLQPELPQFLRVNRDSLSLIRTRTPQTALVALVRMDSVRLGGQSISLIGGVEAENRLLGGAMPSRDLGVALTFPGVSSPDQDARVIRRLSLPFLDQATDSGPSPGIAAFVITQSPGTLEELLQGVGRWVLVALGLTLAVAIAGAAWLSARISRPLRELASKTASIDLDRLDQNFDSERRDEIGALSRLLGRMTDRLRSSSTRIREAERRAAVGDLARQVNHDIKNGLAPIRNVLRHLAQVASQDPSALPQVFEARRATLESSVEYLDILARNYDRLSPSVERRSCDVNAIVEQVVRNASGDATVLRAQLDRRLPGAVGDSLIIRRILENLIGNALDSIAGRPGASVTVSTERLANGSAPNLVRIVVSDTGPGMTQAELDRAFDDFYTTKAGGSGLGLSIVRRLILDLNGSLRVETEPAKGTRVVVDLPGAPGGELSA